MQIAPIVLDDLAGDASRTSGMCVLITRQRAQDALCATGGGVGSIRDSKGVARALSAF
jgi:hypothetical protein